MATAKHSFSHFLTKSLSSLSLSDEKRNCSVTRSAYENRIDGQPVNGDTGRNGKRDLKTFFSDHVYIKWLVYPRFTRVMCPRMRRAHSNINRSSFFTFHPTFPWSFSFPFLFFFLSLLFHVSVFCFRIQSAFSYVAESLPLYSRLKAEPYSLISFGFLFPPEMLHCSLFVSSRNIKRSTTFRKFSFRSLSLSLSLSFLSPCLSLSFLQE